MLAMTSDFHGEGRTGAQIRNSLEHIARAGFSHVHWCHEWTGSYQYSVYEMLQIKKWCAETGLKVKGVHASAGEKNSDLKDYVSRDVFSRLAGVDLIKNRIDLAHCLDAESIALHFNLPWKRFENEKGFRDEFYRHALKSFDELEGYCRTRRIKICIENDGAFPPSHSIFMFETLFNRYDGGYMGLCFDTGHANMACKSNCLEYAQRFNDRLFLIHIHDNQGENDEHLIPFSGSFGWEGFAPVLARSPYDLPILMEPSLREAGDDADWLKKAYEAGNRFSIMTEKYR